MPRDISGNYNLPAGNPVAPLTVITSTWANTTMDDVALALTDSLDRKGRGGMLAPFQFADGNNLLPGAAWKNEPTTGLYRKQPGSGDVRMAVLTQDIMRWHSDHVGVWDADESAWVDIGVYGGRHGLTVESIAVNTNAVTGRLYNLLNGTITLTLPAAPVIGDIVGAFSGNFTTAVIDNNGVVINGVDDVIVMDLIDMCIVLQYADHTIGWVVISQGLSSAVTGGLPQRGTTPGATLVWDDITQGWVESLLYNLGADGVFSGVISGDVDDQKFTRIQVVAALPGTPNLNILYLIPGGGIYLGATLIAGTGWEAGAEANSIINSNSGNIFMATLPVADPAVPGALWNNAGVVSISI